MHIYCNTNFINNAVEICKMYGLNVIRNTHQCIFVDDIDKNKNYITNAVFEGKRSLERFLNIYTHKNKEFDMYIDAICGNIKNEYKNYFISILLDHKVKIIISTLFYPDYGMYEFDDEFCSIELILSGQKLTYFDINYFIEKLDNYIKNS